MDGRTIVTDAAEAPAERNLRALMRDLGLSQRGLARIVGRHERTVGRWCHGEYAVPGYVFTLLAQIRRRRKR